MTDPAPASSGDKASTAPQTPAPGGDTFPTNYVTPSPDAIDGLPVRFGRYEIRQRLGRGGMATVYQAYDTALRRLVALKVPHPEIAADALALERFLREARSAAGLQHPNICTVFDVGEHEGRHYLTMAFVNGPTLAARMAFINGEHGVPIVPFADRPRQAAELVRTLALALQHAHDRGIVHRDLKPWNIMLNERDEPIVMDFGLARRVEADGSCVSSEGVILGTPAYMAPEQAEGRNSAVGPVSDVYSLGVVLYELLAGQVPFRGTVTSILAQVLRDPPPPPSQFRPGLDAGLEAVCLKALAKDPAGRYPTMRAFADALGDWLNGAPQPRTVLPPPTDASGRTAEELLGLLRRWGWRKGVELARARYPAPNDSQSGRTEPSALVEWLAATGPLPEPVLRRAMRLPQWPALERWACFGRASAASAVFDTNRAEEVLEQLPPPVGPPDPVLEAGLLWLRARLLSRRGQWDAALKLLHESLTLYGSAHYETGEVLRLLGSVYDGKGNFVAAREFLEQAIRSKRDLGDQPRLARMIRELGTRYLEWRYLDRAEEQFQAALRVARNCGAEDQEANLWNDLARVALDRLEGEGEGVRRAPARKLCALAADYVERSVRLNVRLRRPVEEGWARLNRGLVHRAERQSDAAADQFLRAEILFRGVRHEHGLVELSNARGGLFRERGQCAEAAEAFRVVIAYYDGANRAAAAARARLELARTLLAADAARSEIAQAFLDAMQRAEACRHPELVRLIDEELRGFDEEAYWRYVFGRARGRGHPEDTASLNTGVSEQCSVLFLDLQGFIAFCQGFDPETVMLSLNQMLGDLTAVLERHGGTVTSYLGGGFMALVRGPGHGERAVDAALEMLRMVAEFNRPREVLGLKLLPASIGIASGAVYLGNVGSYQRLDFTAIGLPANLASRLVRQGDTTAPCISQETYLLVQDRFLFREGNPRTVDLPGLGKREVWDVVGRKGSSSGFSRR